VADIVTLAAWHDWRRGGIGGSDIAGIIGISRWASPWSVWAEKVGLRSPSPATERQDIGKLLEDALAKMFHRRTGLTVAGEQTWCVDPDAPWRRCTVDGFVWEAPPIAPLETDLALGTVQHKTDGRYTWPDGIPPYIRAQCIWEMGVTRHRHAWLNVLHGGFRHEVYPIEFDPLDWEYMVEAADRFWHDHVLTGVAPDIDASDATTYALKAVYPEEEPGARAALDPADVELLGNLKAEAKQTAAELKAVENRLRAQFGDAEIGTIGGRAAYTLRAQTRRTECKACHHVEESEPFRVLRPAPAKLRDLPPIEQDR
jgi:putative phage-type endonuclease